MKALKVAAVQMQPKVGDFESNFSFIMEMSEKACKSGADLVLFPELSLSGYTLDEAVLKKAWEYFKQVSEQVLRLSRMCDMAIIFGTPRIVGGNLRNSTAIFKKKREVLFYDKTHLFRAEKDVFEPGDDFLTFKFKEVTFGVLTCYEIGFPEISRCLTLRGAQVLLVSFAFGKERWKIYDTATKARAIENGCYLVASSTTGKGFMDFIGHTRIVHPSGQVMAELEEEQGMIIRELDLDVLYHYRYEEAGDSHAYFKNRDPRLYKDLCFKDLKKS